MKSKILGSVVVVLLAVMGLLEAGSAGAQGGGDSDAAAVALLKKLEQEYSQIQTIQGQFSQARVDPAFDERIDSTARFFVQRPDRFRVDYLPPRESTNLIADGYSYRYVPELKQVERYRFQNRETAQDLNYLLLGFGAQTESVLKIYEAKTLTSGVPEDRVAIRLTPRKKSDANFNHVTIEFTAGDRPMPALFTLEQLDGTRTSANLDLKSLEFGKQIPAKTFEPSWPRNVQVVDFE